MIQFLKNLSMMGAMFFIIANGAGPWSIDAWLSRRQHQAPANRNTLAYGQAA